MKFIINKIEFDSINLVIESIVDRRRTFPNIVFKKDYSLYSFFGFYRIFTKDFFDKISDFIRRCDDDVFWVSAVDPDPEQYFFKYFLHYGAIECETNGSSEEYIYLLNQDPGNSPADSLVHNSNILIACSPGADWFIWGEREFDIAVCAFRSDVKRNLFLSMFESITLPSALIAADLPLYVREE